MNAALSWLAESIERFTTVAWSLAKKLVEEVSRMMSDIRALATLEPNRLLAVAFASSIL